MDYEKNRRSQDSVYSIKMRAGKRRTYFFDVRQTKGDDYYITMTESTRRYEGDGYVRHKIFLYKEDFNRFLENLQETMDHVKNDLMPEYDYDEFTRKHEEWQRQREEEEAQEQEQEQEQAASFTNDTQIPSEDDLSW